MNEESRRCPHCGRYVIAQDGICPSCGTALGVLDRQATSAPDMTEPSGPNDAQNAEKAAVAPHDAGDVLTKAHDDAAAGVPEEAIADDAADTGTSTSLTQEHPEKTEDAGPPETANETNVLAEGARSGLAEEAPAESEDAAGASRAVPEEPVAPLQGAPSAPHDEPPAKPTSLPDTLGTPGTTIPPVHVTPSGETSTPPRAMTPPATMPPVADALAETGEHEAIPPLPTPSEMMQETQPNLAAQMASSAPGYVIPPAPYTPPPVPAYAPAPYAYAQSADPLAVAMAFLQQRVALYRNGGYLLLAHGPYEATLAYGKGLSVGAWMLALVSGVGLVWYLLLLALSGFRPDEVTIWVERDGRVYEDGPGAAHVRAQRARTGRRWRTVGAVIFALSLFTALVLSAFAGVVLSQERYQAALRQAYPAVTLFEERFSDAPATADDVQLAKDGAVVFGVVAVLATVGLWGGATLWVVGTVHASAYRVRVPPLPGWA